MASGYIESRSLLLVSTREQLDALIGFCIKAFGWFGANTYAVHNGETHRSPNIRRKVSSLHPDRRRVDEPTGFQPTPSYRLAAHFHWDPEAEPFVPSGWWINLGRTIEICDRILKISATIAQQGYRAHRLIRICALDGYGGIVSALLSRSVGDNDG